MKSYKPLDNLVNNVGNYIQNNSEKIWKGAKYLVIFPTVLALGLNVLPKFQKPINKIIPTTNTNISEIFLRLMQLRQKQTFLITFIMH